MKRLLLTSTFRPFSEIENPYDAEGTYAEFFRAHLTTNEPLCIMGDNRRVGLHFIASNLDDTEITVLENPTFEEFAKELKKGYDFAGVSCEVTTFQKAQRMIQEAKSNNTITLVGGCGACVPDWKNEDSLDHLVMGEGAQEISKKLSIPMKAKKFIHPVIINDSSTLLGMPLEKVAYVATGLGCEHGCEFCSTSSFYDCEHIPLFESGKELAEYFAKVHTLTGVKSFTIFDEDFLNNKEFIIEMGNALEKIELPVELNCFASAKSVSQFNYDYLRIIGISSIWLGVESKQAKYKKLGRQDLKEMFKSLRNTGIKTVGSIIIGYDFHTKEAIEEDISYLISLRPDLCQVKLYTPYPDTPSFKKLSRQGRITCTDWKYYNGNYLTFQHPHFDAPQIEKIRHDAEARVYNSLGPSVLRAVETEMNGLLHAREMANKDKIWSMRLDDAAKRISLYGSVLPILLKKCNDHTEMGQRIYQQCLELSDTNVFYRTAKRLGASLLTLHEPPAARTRKTEYPIKQGVLI